MSFQPILQWLFGPHVFDVAATLCIAIGISLALSSDPDDVSRALWFFGIAAALAIGRAGHWLLTDDSPPLPKPVLAAILFGGIGAIWIVVHSWTQDKLRAVQKSQSPLSQTVIPSAQSTQPDNRNPNKPLNPSTLTLEDLFFRDLSSSTMSVYTQKTLRSAQFGDVRVLTCASVDLDRNVVTVGYYIPFSSNTVTVVKDLLWLIDIDKLVKDDLAFKAETRYPGDSNTRSSATAVFTRVVYIYHEKEISAEEIGRLTTLYSSKNLRVQFRSQSYLEVRKLKAETQQSSKN